MAVKDIGLIRDANGVAVRQYYDPVNNRFWPETRQVLSSPPKVGTKTVGMTPTLACVSASSLQYRYLLGVYNESAVTIYFGTTGVSINDGFPIMAGSSMFFKFEPSLPIDIYLVANVEAPVRILELA